MGNVNNNVMVNDEVDLELQMMGALNYAFENFEPTIAIDYTPLEGVDRNNVDIFYFPIEMELGVNGGVQRSGDVPTTTINDPHFVKLAT